MSVGEMLRLKNSYRGNEFVQKTSNTKLTMSAATCRRTTPSYFCFNCLYVSSSTMYKCSFSMSDQYQISGTFFSKCKN